MPDYTKLLDGNSLKAIKTYVDTYFSKATNIQNGTGTNAVQEKMADTTVNFTGRNPNAEALDSTLTATLNTGATGNQSSAFGKNTMALSTASSTFGNKTVAKGEESMAQGYQSVTLGDGSHAEGEQTTSAGSVSHSEGSNTVALSVASHAEGVRSKTQPISGVTDSATGAHAEGESTIASGYCSHTEGFGSYTGPIANAPSYPVTPEPEPSPTPSPTPVIEYGNLAHAEGNYCFAVGTGSHAEGYHTQALHEASHAEGVGTKTYRSGQLVIGWYNATPSSNDLFVIGNGTADNARSNVFTVSLDGKVTAPTFVGNLTGNASTATSATTASNATNATNAQQANLVNINPDSSYVGAILVNSNSNANTVVRKDNITVTQDGRLTVAHDPTNTMDVATKGYVDNRTPNISTEDYVIAPTLTIIIREEYSVANKGYYRVYDGQDTSGTLVYENTDSTNLTPSPQKIKISSGHFYIDCKSTNGVYWWGWSNEYSSSITNVSYGNISGDTSHGYFKGDMSASGFFYINNLSWND